MSPVALIVLATLAGGWLIQLGLVLVYRRASRAAVRRSQPALGPRPPRIAVHMPLRGADPHLGAAIRSLLDQDYPDFELRIVVDSESDPAWEIASETLRAHGSDRARLEALRDKHPRRSLVCSSLLQFLAGLDESFDLIAFAAADVVLPSTWLRRLAATMGDPAVGATLGNRWYTPPVGYWGSLVRYLWNAGAVIVMRLLAIPWAGGLMLRLADVRRAGLPDRWGRAMVEDTSAYRPLREAGLRLEPLPGQLIAIREEISLGDCFRFLRRQILWGRLYHPGWWFILLHALTGSATLLAPVAFAIHALAVGAPRAAMVLAGGLLAYVAGMGLLLYLMESTVAPVLAEQSFRPNRWPPAKPWKIFLAIPLTQLVYTAAALSCLRVRRIEWRGITYRLRGPWEIEMVEYRPFAAADQPTEVDLSV